MMGCKTVKSLTRKRPVATRKRPAAASTAAKTVVNRPSLLTFSIELIVHSTFDEVNSGRSSLALLNDRCDWLAEYVAAIFWCRREGSEEEKNEDGWKTLTRPEREAALAEELHRECRGDYDTCNGASCSEQEETSEDLD